MRTLDLESAIQEFLEIARALQSRPRLDAAEALEALLIFYRDVRIEGAHLENEEDGLILEWGGMSALMLSEPTDLRSFSDSQLIFEPIERRSLDFAREIFAPGDDKTIEFDDAAVRLSLTLFYEPVSDMKSLGDLWINEPAEIESVLDQFRADPFVSALWTVPTTNLVAAVGGIG